MGPVDPPAMIPIPRTGVLIPKRGRIRRAICRHYGRIVLGRMDEPAGYLRSRQVLQSTPGSRLVPKVQVEQCTDCGELFAENTWNLEAGPKWALRDPLS